jgi:DNA-binding PadR family transcriptional regulator
MRNGKCEIGSDELATENNHICQKEEIIASLTAQMGTMTAQMGTIVASLKKLEENSDSLIIALNGRIGNTGLVAVTERHERDLNDIKNAVTELRSRVQALEGSVKDLHDMPNRVAGRMATQTISGVWKWAAAIAGAIVAGWIGSRFGK